MKASTVSRRRGQRQPCGSPWGAPAATVGDRAGRGTLEELLGSTLSRQGMDGGCRRWWSLASSLWPSPASARPPGQELPQCSGLAGPQERPGEANSSPFICPRGSLAGLRPVPASQPGLLHRTRLCGRRARGHMCHQGRVEQVQSWGGQLLYYSLCQVSPRSWQAAEPPEA